MFSQELDIEREKQLKKFLQKYDLNISTYILDEATTHHSIKNNFPEVKDYERLETLGDAVLDLLVLDWFIAHGINTAGSLTNARAEIVNDTVLGEIGEELGLESIIRNITSASGIQREKERKRLFADVIEAIFGAIYLENGLSDSRKFMKLLFSSRLEEVLERIQKGIKKWGLAEKNFRNLLTEFLEKQGEAAPKFTLVWEKGPPHSKLFCYSCQVKYKGKKLKSKAQGRTKKDAKKEAAKKICMKLGLIESNTNDYK